MNSLDHLHSPLRAAALISEHAHLAGSREVSLCGNSQAHELIRGAGVGELNTRINACFVDDDSLPCVERSRSGDPLFVQNWAASDGRAR